MNHPRKQSWSQGGAGRGVLVDSEKEFLKLRIDTNLKLLLNLQQLQADILLSIKEEEDCSSKKPPSSPANSNDDHHHVNKKQKRQRTRLDHLVGEKALSPAPLHFSDDEDSASTILLVIRRSPPLHENKEKNAAPSTKKDFFDAAHGGHDDVHENQNNNDNLMEEYHHTTQTNAESGAREERGPHMMVHHQHVAPPPLTKAPTISSITSASSATALPRYGKIRPQQNAGDYEEQHHVKDDEDYQVPLPQQQQEASKSTTSKNNSSNFLQDLLQFSSEIRKNPPSRSSPFKTGGTDDDITESKSYSCYDGYQKLSKKRRGGSSPTPATPIQTRASCYVGRIKTGGDEETVRIQQQQGVNASSLSSLRSHPANKHRRPANDYGGEFQQQTGEGGHNEDDDTSFLCNISSSKKERIHSSLSSINGHQDGITTVNHTPSMKAVRKEKLLSKQQEQEKTNDDLPNASTTPTTTSLRNAPLVASRKQKEKEDKVEIEWKKRADEYQTLSMLTKSLLKTITDDKEKLTLIDQQQRRKQQEGQQEAKTIDVPLIQQQHVKKQAVEWRNTSSSVDYINEALPSTLHHCNSLYHKNSPTENLLLGGVDDYHNSQLLAAALEQEHKLLPYQPRLNQVPATQNCFGAENYANVLSRGRGRDSFVSSSTLPLLEQRLNFMYNHEEINHNEAATMPPSLLNSARSSSAIVTGGNDPNFLIGTERSPHYADILGGYDHPVLLPSSLCNVDSQNHDQYKLQICNRDNIQRRRNEGSSLSALKEQARNKNDSVLFVKNDHELFQVPLDSSTRTKPLLPSSRLHDRGSSSTVAGGGVDPLISRQLKNNDIDSNTNSTKEGLLSKDREFPRMPALLMSHNNKMGGGERSSSNPHRHNYADVYHDQKQREIVTLPPGTLQPPFLNKATLHSIEEKQQEVTNMSISVPRDRNWLPLGLESDKEHLSQLLCFLRAECIEVFTASNQDVMDRMTSKKVREGQVGVRCRFCAHVRLKSRVGRSSNFPSSISKIYTGVSMMIYNHFALCREMPQPIREKFDTLKTFTKKGNAESRSYWIRSATKLGLVDAVDGVQLDPALCHQYHLRMKPNEF